MIFWSLCYSLPIEHYEPIKECAQFRQILSAHIKYYPFKGLSHIIVENSLKQLQNLMENQLFILFWEFDF